MVSCRLVGRLGNQAFIIAATIGYAIKHKTPYWIPRQSINERIWPAFFKHFPPEPEEYRKYFIYKEPDFSYREIPFKESIILHGYWQSEKYFAHCRPYILSAFQIPYQKLDGFVSIHVRRTDYVTQFSDKHPPVTIEYLKEAIQHFIDLGYRSFVVCSDDIKWCKEHLMPMELRSIVFSYSAGHTPIEDLALLSCAEHQICSNSSFSWWGYYLNQNPDKVGIFPKVWFGPGNSHLDPTDLYPQNCIKL